MVKTFWHWWLVIAKIKQISDMITIHSKTQQTAQS